MSQISTHTTYVPVEKYENYADLVFQISPVSSLKYAALRNELAYLECPDQTVQISRLRGIETHGKFSATVYKGDNFCVLQFAFLHTDTLLKRDLLSKGKNSILLQEVNSFLFKAGVNSFLLQ